MIIRVESPVKTEKEEDGSEKIVVEGPFTIKRYKTGGVLELVCELKDWKAFEGWEGSLRREYAKNEAASRSGAKPLNNKANGKPLQPLQISSRLANP